MFSIIFMFSKLYSMFSNPGVQDSTICSALLVPTSRYLMSKIAKICWHPKKGFRTTIWFFLRGGVIRRNVFDNWICGWIGWTSFVSVIFCICVFLYLLERSLIIGFVEEVVGHRCTPFSTLEGASFLITCISCSSVFVFFASTFYIPHFSCQIIEMHFLHFYLNRTWVQCPIICPCHWLNCWFTDSLLWQGEKVNKVTRVIFALRELRFYTL